MRLKNQALPIAVCSIAFFTASSGFWAAALRGRIISGDDAIANVLYLADFHENIAHGNLFPAWSANLNSGYGEPHLLIRQPLQSYLAEFFHLITGNLFVAIDLSCIAALLLATIGMFFLAQFLWKAFFAEEDSHSWAIATMTSSYVLGPYVAYDFYSRAANTEALAFAVFPWLTLAFLRLSIQPTPRNIAFAGFLYYCLAVTHPLMLMITTPFLMVSAYCFRQHIKKPAAWALAMSMGLLTAAHYLIPILVEMKFMKSSLMTAGRFAYSQNFCRLDQLFTTPWQFYDYSHWYSPGLLYLLVILSAAWVWSDKSRQWPQDNLLKRTFLLLLAFSGVCVHLIHRTSTIWYEWLPSLQTVQFPMRFLTVFTFFSSILCFLTATVVFRKSWQWKLLLGLIFVYGLVGAKHARFSEYKTKDFTSEAIIRAGWGMAIFEAVPATVPMISRNAPAHLVETVSGKAAADCARNSPTVVECRVAVTTPSTLRLNVYDYPNWTTSVNGGPAKRATLDPLNGTMLVTLDRPGEHAVRWELKDPWDRSLGKILTVLGFLGLSALMLWDVRKAACSRLGLMRVT